MLRLLMGIGLVLAIVVATDGRTPKTQKPVEQEAIGDAYPVPALAADEVQNVGSRPYLRRWKRQPRNPNHVFPRLHPRHGEEASRGNSE